MRVPARLRIFAVEMPATQVIGTAPSPAVRAALPELVRRVKRAAAEWGYGGGGGDGEPARKGS